jgi:predicted enzyme related to lactoylglutathione lyase
MSGPARAGLFLYALNMEAIAAFYAAIVGMETLSQTAELMVLESPDIQLLIHRIPDAIAATISLSSPPVRREDTALKFFFTVPSLAEARRTARALGGEVGDEHWQGPGFIVCHAVDPEGNIFQLREATAGPTPWSW